MPAMQRQSPMQDGSAENGKENEKENEEWNVGSLWRWSLNGVTYLECKTHNKQIKKKKKTDKENTLILHLSHLLKIKLLKIHYLYQLNSLFYDKVT